MKTPKSAIAGWVLSALISLFLIGASGVPKLIDFPGKAEMMDKLGWSLERIAIIGYVEIAIAALFLIPRAAFIAAVLLTAYLGGATATHVRIADPFIFPVLLAVLAWIALGLRDPRVFATAFGKRA